MTDLIHAKGGIIPQNRGHIRQEQPATLRPGDRRRLLVKDPSTTFLRNKSPNQNRNPRNRDHHRFDSKQPAQFIRMHTQERELQDPKNQERNHPIRRDTLRRGDIIPQLQITGPNRPDHDTDRIPPIHILDSKPEHGENQPRNDGDIRAPEAPAGAGNHREGDVVGGADGAITGNHEGDDEEGDGYDGNCFTVRETDGDDAACKLPCCCIEGVRDPVC